MKYVQNLQQKHQNDVTDVIRKEKVKEKISKVLIKNRSVIIKFGLGIGDRTEKLL